MSSIQTPFLNLKAHHSQYPAIDPKAALKASASDKVVFITGASQGIGQATAVAFAQAGIGIRGRVYTNHKCSSLACPKD